MLTNYKQITIVDYVGEPTAAEIEAIETEIGATLPADFRDFLFVANGGYLPYLVNVPPTPEGEPLCFCDLFSTRLDENGRWGPGTFIGEIPSQPDMLNIPQKVLPFARDGGGSTVYLDLTEEGNGRVVVFVHGLPPWAGARQHSSFVELASDFPGFIDLLYLNLEDAALFQWRLSNGWYAYLYGSMDHSRCVPYKGRTLYMWSVLPLLDNLAVLL